MINLGFLNVRLTKINVRIFNSYLICCLIMLYFLQNSAQSESANGACIFPFKKTRNSISPAKNFQIPFQ